MCEGPFFALRLVEMTVLAGQVVTWEWKLLHLWKVEKNLGPLSPVESCVKHSGKARSQKKTVFYTRNKWWKAHIFKKITRKPKAVDLLTILQQGWN